MTEQPAPYLTGRDPGDEIDIDVVHHRTERSPIALHGVLVENATGLGLALQWRGPADVRIELTPAEASRLAALEAVAEAARAWDTAWAAWGLEQQRDIAFGSGSARWKVRERVQARAYAATAELAAAIATLAAARPAAPEGE